MLVRTAEPLPSPARVHAPTRPPVRIGVVQLAWDPDERAHDAAISEGVRTAADEGADLVCLPELTRLPYIAYDERGPQPGGIAPEPLPGGSTYELVAKLAVDTGVAVHASCYEQSGSALGFNTAFVVAPDGTLAGKARKMHLPVTAGYAEDRWFAPGDTGYPVFDIANARVGLPTCYDQWFPEVSRALALNGADVIVYPSAIGSEPDHPAFDTEPIWEQVIRAQGVMSGTFMVVINRIGTEGPNTFYGSSFVSDPYGRVLVQAPRAEPCVLVADLDLDMRRDWLDLFPMFAARRPETY